MSVPYVGNSTYCYSNSLAMCLRHVHPDVVPEVGFIECATVMPFGAMFLTLESGPLFFPNPAGLNPDQGLTEAMATLGWDCETWRGDDPEEALAHLLDALRFGPALLGPLDMGFLAYDPHAQFKRGADHFVVALWAENDLIVLHDPQLYPYATIEAPSLLDAWKGSHLGYAEHDFTMRFGFQRRREVTRPKAISRTLEVARSLARRQHDGPVLYGGRAAFERAAKTILEDGPDGLKGMMTMFALPVGARRSLDAAAFAAEGNATNLAELLRKRGERFGRAQREATRGAWTAISQALMQLADIEDHVQDELERIS